MKLGIELKGVDFVVEQTQQTKADREFISKVISHYKATVEILKAPTPQAKPSKLKKERITNP